jgi:hypothetical protein
MFSWLDAYLQARKNGTLLAYLWLPHNEHHMVLIRVLTAIDVSAFHASGVPFVVAATTALVITALLVLIELRPVQSPLGALAWLGPMLLLSTAAAVDCSIPINSVYPLALVFVVATLVLFDGEAERGRFTSSRRVAGILMAILASMANAVGLIAWPVLLWSAWRGGAKRTWLLTIIAIGGAYGMIYMHGLQSFDQSDPVPILTVVHLRKMADYLLVYLGLPLSRAPGLGLPARLLGGVLLVTGAVAIVRDMVSPKDDTRLHRIGIGLVMAALAAAFLAAVGRVDLDPDVKVPVRYALMVAPLHIGLLALALSALARRTSSVQAGAQRRQVVCLAIGAALAAVLLLLQVMAGRSAVIASGAIATTLDHYQAGFRDPGMERVVFPDLAEADQISAALHAFETGPLLSPKKAFAGELTRQSERRS